MDRKKTQRPREPHQLPPGRHKLGRRFVKSNQRDRILTAVTDVSTLAGYGAMSVEDIISVAGVSRRTFYDAFSSKEDAFLHALDAIVEDLEARITMAYDATDTFPRGVLDSLAAFLHFVTEEPRRAEVLLIEALAAGPAAIERRRTTLKTFANLLGEAAERLGNGRRPPNLTAETVVGGIFEIVYSRLIAGEADQLEALLPDLAYSLMQPYIGDAAAKRESVRRPSVEFTPGTAVAPA